MTNKTPSGAEKYHESFEPESSKTTKMFFFLSFFLSSFFFRWASSTLRELLTHETATFYMEQCTTSSLLHNIEVLQGARSHSLKNCGFHFGAPCSSFIHVHAHFRITQQRPEIYYSRSANQKHIWCVCTCLGVESNNWCMRCAVNRMSPLKRLRQALISIINMNIHE